MVQWALGWEVGERMSLTEKEGAGEMPPGIGGGGQEVTCPVPSLSVSPALMRGPEPLRDTGEGKPRSGACSQPGPAGGGESQGRNKWSVVCQS